MGNFIKKIRFVFSTILVSFLVASPCFAADNIVSLTADKTDLTAGEEITLTADFPDEAKIYALTATLQYDQNVFEPINEANFDLPETTSVLYNSNNQKFGIVNQTGEVDDNLLSVRLRVKNDANVGDTNIALTNISSSDGSSTVNYDLASTKVSVTRTAAEGEVVPTNQENVITETPSEPQSVFYSTPFIVGAIVVVAAIALFIVYRQGMLSRRESKLPYALAALAVVVIAIVIGVLAVNRGKEDVDGNGTVDYTDAGEIIGYLIDYQNQGESDTAEEASSSTQPATTAGSANSSSRSTATTASTASVNYSSSSSASSSSNSSSSSSSSNPSSGSSSSNPSSPKPPEDYDTNDDGKVDVGDAGHNTEEVEKQTTVELSKVDAEQYYAQKGNQAVQFVAKISPAEITLKEVKINGQDYEINPADINGEYYTVNVEPMFAAGQHEYHITEVQTSNGKTIPVNLDFSYEALKEKPKVIDFKPDLENHQIGFKLEDTDHAFQQGEVKIYNADDRENPLVTQSFDTADFVTVTDEAFATERGTFYVEITGDYCLVDDQSNATYCYHGENLLSHQFTMDDHYDFVLSNFTLTDYVEPGNHPIMNFQSFNAKGLSISNIKVKIDNSEVEFPVKLTGDGTFEVVLEHAEMQPGQRHNVQIQEVTLSDGMVFVNPDDFSIGGLTYLVPSNSPKVTDLTLNGEKSQKKITAKFKLDDPSATVSKLEVVLVDGADNIVATDTITSSDINGKNDFSVSFDYSGLKDRAFTVKVLADYDLGNQYSFTNTQLAEGPIEVFDAGMLYVENNVVTASSIATNSSMKITRYAEKGQKGFGVAMKLVKDANYPLRGACGVYSTNSAYTVNGNNYNSFGFGTWDKLTGMGYNRGVVFGVPNESGVVDIAITRTQYISNGYNCEASDWFSIPKVNYQFEVLRDAPKIENLKITHENYDEQTVTFEFDVVTDAKSTDGDENFISGKLKFGDSEAEIPQRGHNIITLQNVAKDEKHELEFKATYDRDTDTFIEEEETDQNQVTDAQIYKTEYTLRNPDQYQNVEVKNGEALTSNKEVNDKYFEKNEEIGLYFDVAGLPEDAGKPVAAILDGKGDAYKLLQIVNATGEEVPNSYAVFAPGYSEAGARTLTVTNLIFENGQNLTVQQTQPISFEVLKDAPTITDLGYKFDGYSITLKSKLNNAENSLVGTPTVEIIDELDESIYKGSYSEEIKIDDYNGANYYYVKVIGDYNRASDDAENTKNKYQFKNQVILDEPLSLSQQYIELKNITDVNLYHVSEGRTELVDEVSKSEINSNPSSYFLEIAMRDLPTLSVNIKDAVDLDGSLYLTIDSEALTVEDEYKYQNNRINFGVIGDNDKAKNETHFYTAFENLISRLQKGESVDLDRDYDASAYTLSENNYYIDEFSGTLNGNGHTIKNFSAPLFNKLTENASVQDLTLDNVFLDGTGGKGALANEANKADIEGVIVNNFTNNNAPAGSGSLVGSATSTHINKCASLNFSINVHGNQQSGGFVGIMSSGSIVDSYATGSLSATWNHVGGFVGTASYSPTLERNYSKITYSQGGGNYVACGFACGGFVAKHNISLNTLSGDFNAVYSPGSGSPFMNNFSSGSKENFYLANNGYEIAEKHKAYVDTITKEQVNKNLFEQAGFTDDTWHLDSNTSYDNPPRLKIEKLAESALESKEGFNSYNLTAYSNVTALTPYYEYEEIIKQGNKVTDTDLATKQIQHIVPVDANGGLVTYLTTAEPNKVAQVKIVFNDGSSQTYDADYVATYDMVASYRIRKLHLDYNFPHYVIDTNSRLVDNLTYYLKNLDYTNNLDNLTAAADSRIYRDFYNDTTSNELKEFVFKYLSNSNFTNVTNDEDINAQIERIAKQDGRMVKTLYVYNYLRRFYDLDIDGMKLYDFTLFNMNGFNNDLTAANIVDKFFVESSKADSAMFRTSSTNGTFRTIYKQATGFGNISEYLQFVVQHFGHGQSMSDWVHSQFKGFLTERSIDNSPDYNSDTGLTQNSDAQEQNTGVLYTLWDHFSHPDALQKGGEGGNTSYAVYNYVLPILTLPEKSTYIISTPCQFIIGSQRSYIADPDAPNAYENFNFRVRAYADRMKTYYTTAYRLFRDTNQMNDMQLYTLDKINAYNDSGIISRQRPGSTTDPHHKNFNEVIGRFSADGGINAGAYSDRVEFDVAGVMDATIQEVAEHLDVSPSENTFGTWSHETAHMIDARLWMRNNGRRWDAGGEDYADGNLRQEFDGNLIVMNLTKDWGKDCGFGSPCSPSRIDTQEEVKDFYSKAFDVLYAIDYIEGLAFLQLTPEQQAVLGAQMSYPNEKGENFDETLKASFPDGFYSDEKARFRAYQTTKYSRPDANAFKNMNLNTVQDLYNNKITVYPGLYGETSRGSNSYGGEGVNVTHWYVPYNDYGRPDSYSLKWTAYEMLGLAGYDNGYIEYYSNINPDTSTHVFYKQDAGFNRKEEATYNNYKTDLMALRKITGKEDITFDEYRLGRIKETEEKLDKLNKAVDVEEYVQKFYDALIKDYQRETVDLEAFFKNVETNGHPNGARSKEACLKDTFCMNGYAPYKWDGVANYIRKENSTAVRQEIYQILKKMTNDFVDNGVIFKDTKQQSFSSIEELRHSVKQSETETKSEDN